MIERPEYDRGRPHIEDLDMGTVLVPKQVVHDDRQVRNPSQLEIGKFYESMPIRGKLGIFKLLKIDSPKKGWIEIECQIKLANYNHNISMADSGIIPYPNSGRWNPSGYMVAVEAPEQVVG